MTSELQKTSLRDGAIWTAHSPSVSGSAGDRAGVIGALMARVYQEAADPYHWYGVEYRRAVGWDRGLSRRKRDLRAVRRRSSASGKIGTGARVGEAACASRPRS